MAIIVMGVTGCGKTTVGMLLAQRLHWDFYDADDFHPPQNVAKMRTGIPLTDSDRLPWLQALHELLRTRQGRGTVLACSALKRHYRAALTEQLTLFRFAFLSGDFQLIQDRLHSRRNHYMNPTLLSSQFEALEEPSVDERAVRIEIGSTPGSIVEEIAAVMGFCFLPPAAAT